MGTDKFCLKWNDFETNISVAFKELRDDKDFFDVTLACEDNQMQAHKVILSACSPFFRNILRRNPHQHPLLYLRGVKHSDLQCVLNFMYHGEVNVAQEELNSFLAVAEELRVKGLTQGNSSSSSSQSTSESAKRDVPPPVRPRSPPPPIQRTSSEANKRPRTLPPRPQPEDDDIQEVVPIKSEPREPVAAAPPVQQVEEPVVQEDHSLAPYQEDEGAGYEEDYGQYDDGGHYDQTVDIHQQQAAHQTEGKGGIEKPEDLQMYITKDPESKEFFCSLCTFKSKIPALVRNHLEGIHFPGLFVYSCDLCSKTFKGQNALRVHNSKFHSNKNKFA